jgi:hypothetical protein
MLVCIAFAWAKIFIRLNKIELIGIVVMAQQRNIKCGNVLMGCRFASAVTQQLIAT